MDRLVSMHPKMIALLVSCLLWSLVASTPIQQQAVRFPENEESSQKSDAYLDSDEYLDVPLNFGGKRHFLWTLVSSYDAPHLKFKPVSGVRDGPNYWSDFTERNKLLLKQMKRPSVPGTWNTDSIRLWGWSHIRNIRITTNELILLFRWPIIFYIAIQK